MCAARSPLAPPWRSRWAIKECFQTAKTETGLGQYRVRRYDARHRHATLAMLALAFLTMAALAEHAQPPPPGMIPLTRNEIAFLSASLITRSGHGTGHRLRWSAWRRHHQHTARTCHYRRQAARDP